MRVSRFDLVTSLLTSLIWFAGTVVSVLFLVWLLSWSTQPERLTSPPRLKFLGAAAGSAEPDFEEPKGPEIEQLDEIDLAAVVAQIDSASTVLAGQPAVGNDTVSMVAGQTGGQSSPPGDGDDEFVPRWERWQIVFKTKNRKEYAQQLDWFQMELGVFGGGKSGIDSVSKLSTEPTVKHNDKPKTEKRIYFSAQQKSEIREYDKRIAAEAGITTDGRNIVKFISPKTENMLAHLELQYAKHNGVHDVRKIAKTVFETRRNDIGKEPNFSFTVVKQRYR